MSFFAPSLGILEFDEIPVECVHCGYSETRTDFADETKQAVIETTVHSELDTERKMLQRTRLLFDRYPKSRHPIILNKTGRRKTVIPSSDPAFESELIADPELHEFLTNGGFNLDARESFVASRIPELLPYTEREDLRCHQCGAYLVIPRSFYYQVGCYFDVPPEV